MHWLGHRLSLLVLSGGYLTHCYLLRAVLSGAVVCGVTRVSLSRPQSVFGFDVMLFMTSSSASLPSVSLHWTASTVAQASRRHFFNSFPCLLPQMKIPSKKMAHIPVYTVGFHSSPKSHHRKSEVYKWVLTTSLRSADHPHLVPEYWRST